MDNRTITYLIDARAFSVGIRHFDCEVAALTKTVCPGMGAGGDRITPALRDQTLVLLPDGAIALARGCF